VEDISALTADTSTKGTQWGTGGMATKLTAGRIATAAGTTMVICNSDRPENIGAVLAGTPRIGTKFHPLTHALHGRKRWVVAVPVRGHLWLDAGAVAAVRDRHKSLFSAGILRVQGKFNPQDAVAICDEHGAEFARGLCNFTSEEVIKMKGKPSRAAREALGYAAAEEVVHRENLALLTASGADETDEEAPAARTPSRGPALDAPTAAAAN